MSRNRISLVALFCAGLTACLLGRMYLIYYREFLWGGMLFWGIAIISLVMIVRISRRYAGRTVQQRLPILRRIAGARMLRVLGGISLVTAASLGAVRRRNNCDFSDPFISWLTAVLWFRVALVPPVT